LEEGRSRIRNRCDRLQKCLQENDVPFIPADSGMFVWMDLTEFTNDGILDIDTMERQLYLELLQNGLLFTPGRSMKNESPGFFRCVFTAATDEGFDLALSRITKFVRSKRNSST
jgi:DNA-binding transcriptional MocR family regulator